MITKGVSTCLKDHCQDKLQEVSTYDWDSERQILVMKMHTFKIIVY